MMAGTHPDEITLLDLVEGDLEGGRAAEVSAHLEGCPDCAETVRRLEGARAALRESGLLELPAGEREAIVARLPAREPPRRRARPSVGRLVAVLAPVAAAAAVVAVVLVVEPTAGERTDEAGEAAPAFAEEEAGDAAAQAPELQSEVPVRSVRGPASEVARLLREAGFESRVVEGGVHVEGASRAEVRRALAERSDGAVAVVVVP